LGLPSPNDALISRSKCNKGNLSWNKRLRCLLGEQYEEGIAKRAMEKVESTERFPLSHSPDYYYCQHFGPGITPLTFVALGL
jgi:hypothetical protein